MFYAKKGNQKKVTKYALKIKSQIDSLKNIGIQSNKITIIETSKGGYIAQLISSFFNDTNLNFVFIGCYRNIDLKLFPIINFCGNILNIYEKSDPYRVSAIQRKINSKCEIVNFSELELNTGMNHEFLF